MKTFSLLIAAAIALAPVVTFADEGDRDQTIAGRSHQSIISILQQKGIDAHRVEEWGGAIRADTRDSNGSAGYVLIDKNTLQIGQPAVGVATKLSVRPNHSSWPADVDTTASLVESGTD